MGATRVSWQFVSPLFGGGKLCIRTEPQFRAHGTPTLASNAQSDRRHGVVMPDARPRFAATLDTILTPLQITRGGAAFSAASLHPDNGWPFTGMIT